MTPVIVESPYAGDDLSLRARNKAYLEKCLRWCVLRNYTPYASHKMLMDCLDDFNAAERTAGIQAGLEMSRALLRGASDAHVIFFEDYGMSRGMQSAFDCYEYEGLGHRVSRMTIGDLGVRL